jgi:hypothetical protein
LAGPRERWGIYVWTDPQRCCSGTLTYLKTARHPSPEDGFIRFDAEGFELWFDPGPRPAPDELHFDLKGVRKKRVEAYWNGCVFAV